MRCDYRSVAKWVADKGVDVIVATGGTGLTGRDGTPEAFQAIFEKEIEEFGELLLFIIRQDWYIHSAITCRRRGG